VRLATETFAAREEMLVPQLLFFASFAIFCKSLVLTGKILARRIIDSVSALFPLFTSSSKNMPKIGLSKTHFEPFLATSTRRVATNRHLRIFGNHSVPRKRQADALASDLLSSKRPSVAPAIHANTAEDPQPATGSI
jgi:hypothetical protein